MNEKNQIPFSLQNNCSICRSIYTLVLLPACALNDPSFHWKFITRQGPMCELVIIAVPFMLLMIMIISRAFSLFLVLKEKREVLRKREMVYGFKEYLLMKSTGIVTIGGQSRTFFPFLSFHDYSSIRLGFFSCCLKTRRINGG